MTDASIVFVAVSQGIVLGILGLDMVSRWNDRKSRAKLKLELQEAQKGLAELHNKNAETIKTLQDKVSNLSLAIGGGRLK